MPKFTFLLLPEYIEMLKRSREKHPNLFLEYKHCTVDYFCPGGQLFLFCLFIEVSSSSSSPRWSKFSIRLASIPNGENMRFRPAIFIRLIVALFWSKWHKNLACHSAAKTLLFMTVQKLRGHTPMQ